jgi:hypothetical protein
MEANELIYTSSIEGEIEPSVRVICGDVCLLEERGEISKIIMILLEMGRKSNAFEKMKEKYPGLVDEAITKCEEFKNLLL